MKSFVIFLVCIVPLIDCRSIGGRETDTCIADYLKSKGLVGAQFGSDRPLNPFCTAIVEITKNHILDSVRLEVLSDKDMRKEADCVMNSLKKSEFGNSLLVVYVYELTDGIAEAERTEMLKQAQTKVTRATFDAFMTCQADQKFGQLFDELLEADSSSEEETKDQEDYCIRKHIIDNKLIDTNRFHLKLNPKHLDTSTIDCNVVYQKALKVAEDELVEALLDDDSSEENEVQSNIDPSNVTCLLDVVRHGNYIDKMVHFDYVREFDLDASRKSELRQKFIIVMTKLAEDSSKCFL